MSQGLRSRTPQGGGENADKQDSAEVQQQTAKPGSTLPVESMSEGEMRSMERIIGMTMYTTLLFVTVVAGMTYAYFSLQAQDNLDRARYPKEMVHLHAPVPSYLADKRNFLNQIFVKKAWGWTSLAFGVLLAAKPARGSVLSHTVKPVLRYTLATLYWLLFTTWFFGPSVTDRVLMLTGAQCIPSSQLEASRHAQSTANTSSTFPTLEHEHCLSGSAARQALKTEMTQSILTGTSPRDIAPAYWQGGHDISGHTFMLVHASLFLLIELAPLFSALWRPRDDKLAIRQTWRRAAIWSVAGLMVLWWTMLLATSVYFHTPKEKLTGFAVGAAEAFVVQYLVGV